MREKCESHDGICEQITATRIAVARVEEIIKPLPQLVEDVHSIKIKVGRMVGFVAGISATVSIIITLVTLVLTVFKDFLRI